MRQPRHHVPAPKRRDNPNLPAGNWLSAHDVAQLLGITPQALSAHANGRYSWLPTPIVTLHTGSTARRFCRYWTAEETTAAIAAGRPQLDPGWHSVLGSWCAVWCARGARPSKVLILTGHPEGLDISDRLTAVEDWVREHGGCDRYVDSPSPAIPGCIYPLRDMRTV